MTNLLVLLFCIVAFPAFSQPGYPTFGKADVNELLLKECPFEKEAAAMKLLDYQVIDAFFNAPDFRIQTERRIKIKIFNKDGFDAANIDIAYIQKNRKSKVNDITAYIYNLDSSTGKIITQKLERNQIFKERAKEGISSVTFTMPDVRAGSVIEYRYTVNDKNSYHIDPWFFDDKIPTAVSICKLIYPFQLVIDNRLIAKNEVTRQSSSKQSTNIEVFSLKNIPAFKEETMMSSIKDNLQRVEFAFVPLQNAMNILLGTNPWDIFNNRLYISSYFGQQIRDDITETKYIIDSAKKIVSQDHKVQFIYREVSKALQWDKTFSFYADNLNDVWKNKQANSAEINLSILNLLSKSNVKCTPILVSTRDNGKTDREFTSLAQFNSVDVFVGDTTSFYIIDGTQQNIAFKTPPLNILNRDVLLLDALETKWIRIADKRPFYRTDVAVIASLNHDAVLKGDVTISYYDYLRAQKIKEQTEKQRTEKDFMEKDGLAVTVDSVREENTNNELLPLVHKFGFNYELSNTGDYYFLDPFFIAWFRQNPFAKDERKTDIDMVSNQSYTIDLLIKLPDNYLIEVLPENLSISSPDSSILFKREIIKQDKAVRVRNTFDIYRPIYKKEEYKEIKEYFKNLYDKINEPIVLKPGK